MDYVKRLEKVRNYMAENNIAGLILPPSGDLEYLSGIRRQRPNAGSTHAYGDWLTGLYVTQNEAVYVIPEMHKGYIHEQAASKPFITEVIELKEGSDLYACAKDIWTRFKMANQTVAIPKLAMSKMIINFQKFFPETKFVCSEDFIAPMRMVKDAEEVALMKKACEETDKIFQELVKTIQIGETEVEIASRLEFIMLQHGSEGPSFCSGVQLQDPSLAAVATDAINRFSQKTVQKGCSLAFDFGIILDGYCSDFGRTIYIGEPSKKQQEIHKVVMDSQAAAIKAMKAGQITAEGLDKVARDYIYNAGYVNNEFFHRLGHGIGIDVHEYPYLNYGYTEVLQENMMFTIEPSIHAPGVWTRVEDIVMVTKDGGVNLNSAPGVNDFIVIGE